MDEYFRPLRRKLGVVTLVVACVFMAGMVRSLSIGDNVTFFTGALRGETFTSNNSYLGWRSWKISENPQRRWPPPTSSVVWNRHLLGKDSLRPDEEGGIECRFRCLIFGFGADGGSLSIAFAHRVWFLSYWAAVIPLLLLSAYLLLTKPRPSISKKNTESVTADPHFSLQHRTGFVTLLLACALMGGWARSFYFADHFGFSEDSRRKYFCESIDGSLRWIYFDISSLYFAENGSDEPENGMEANDVEQEDEEQAGEENVAVDLVGPTYHGWQVASRSQAPANGPTDWGFRLTSQFMGFGRGNIISIDGAKSVPGAIWFVPYWSIVMPLTVLSAWLLLSKPRKAQSLSDSPTQPPVTSA